MVERDPKRTIFLGGWASMAVLKHNHSTMPAPWGVLGASKMTKKSKCCRTVGRLHLMENSRWYLIVSVGRTIRIVGEKKMSFDCKFKARGSDIQAKET